MVWATLKSSNTKTTAMEHTVATPSFSTPYEEQPNSSLTSSTPKSEFDLKSYLIKLSKNMEGIYLPYISQSLNIPMHRLCRMIIPMFPEAHMENNLLNLQHRPKEWHVEVCWGKYHRGNTLPSTDLDKKLYGNGKEDLHVSVFEHDSAWKKQASKGSVAGLKGWIRASSIWIELDRKADGGFKKALRDAETFLENFPHTNHVRLWHSGNQSVHIEINGALFGNPSGRADVLAGRGRYIYNLAHDLFGSIRHPGGPVDPWLNRKEAQAYWTSLGKPLHEGFQQDLENIDPNIYGVNSLIRAKWSKHEKGGIKRILVGPEVFEPVAPHMIHTYIKACEIRKKQVAIPTIEYDEDIVQMEFSDIPGFDPDNADSEGWVRDLLNPFYDDHKPSLSVNIYDGRFWDFGDPNYQFGFVKYVMIKYNWSYEQATKHIEQNQ